MGKLHIKKWKFLTKSSTDGNKRERILNFELWKRHLNKFCNNDRRNSQCDSFNLFYIDTASAILFLMWPDWLIKYTYTSTEGILLNVLFDTKWYKVCQRGACACVHTFSHFEINKQTQTKQKPLPKTMTMDKSIVKRTYPHGSGASVQHLIRKRWKSGQKSCQFRSLSAI